MDWLWPGFLFLLGLVPLMIAAYIWVLRRRRRFAVRYSSLALVREALPQHAWWRRHLPFALFTLGLTSLIAALGRPVAIVSVPTGKTTIILAIDVSRSMCATDIPPSRLEAAQAAALSFIQSQRPGTQIGIVAFGGFAEVIQAPTTDSELLQDAVESLTTGRRTAIGSGILKSLDAIAEIDPNVAPSLTGTARGVEPTPVPKGAYAPDIIVLLTDGVSNSGPIPVNAAQQAVDRGVRVYTIGFGTANGGGGSAFYCGQQFQGGSAFGGGQFGGGGGGFRRGIDEATLKQVADMTGGEYYSAESASELHNVFRNLPTHLITRHEIMEISVAFTAIGALLAALAISLSLIWHPLP
jgi:Ca-activated chloride channel family protein